MIDTKFKPDSELKLALKDKENIAIFSCDLCASFSTDGMTGGYKGMTFMKQKLENWGKKVIVGQTLLTCCAESILKEAFNLYLKPVASRCDAIVILSCAGGVKTAFLCSPGIPVIAALDSSGSLPVTHKMDNLITNTVCKGCGQCVVSYTNGICPVGRCPEKRQFGPCDDAPMDSIDKSCVVDRSRDCIWREIADRGGDLDVLKELEEMYESGMHREIITDDYSWLPAFTIRFIRRFIGWFISRTSNILARIIPFFN